MRKRDIAWLLASLVPFAGAFAFYYVCMHSYYAALDRRRRLLERFLTLADELKELGVEIPEEPLLRRRREALHELREAPVRPPFLCALLAALVDILRLVILQIYVEDVEALTGRRTRLPVVPLLAVGFLIDGLVLGALAKTGLSVDLSPSMSLLNLLWVAATVTERLTPPGMISGRALLMLVVCWCALKSVLVLASHGALLSLTRIAEVSLSVEDPDLEEDVKHMIRFRRELERAEIPPPRPTAVCPHCGREIPRVAIFCPWCGAKVRQGEGGEP